MRLARCIPEGAPGFCAGDLNMPTSTDLEGKLQQSVRKTNQNLPKVSILFQVFSALLQYLSPWSTQGTLVTSLSPFGD